MKHSFNYQGFTISKADDLYVAKSSDDESCELRSKYLVRALRAIDTLWTATSTRDLLAPSWFQDYLNNPVARFIDLDTVSDALNEQLPEQCRADHLDPISILKFPMQPKIAARLELAS